MNISTAFVPPFKLIAPFFIIGTFVYVACIALLFGLDVQELHNLNVLLLSWVHLFFLGFVMMIIFGAMAQLVPVVLEVGHFAVELYYAIYPLLLIGVVLMVFGFYQVPLLLPFGGVIAFIAFAIFLFETFLTIVKIKKLNFVITAIIIANILLLFGLIVGIVMSLGYSGILDVDIYNLLKAHVYLVLFGFVGITIMGMNLVLLPMFWLSHNFTWFYVKLSIVLLSFGILNVFFSAIFEAKNLEYIGYILSLFALILYFYQIYIIYKKRVRLETDIYFKSVVFAYLNLLVALILGGIYLIYPSQKVLLTLSWLVIGGFIAYIIIGHLYKIIPFLVWYERFSPYVGQKNVPMLADIVPVKSSNMQFLFSAFGVVIIACGIFFGNDVAFKSGLSFLIAGAVFLFKDIVYMVNFKDEKNV